MRGGGGGGRGLTTARNKSAIGGRNLFVDGPLFDEQVFTYVKYLSLRTLEVLIVILELDKCLKPNCVRISTQNGRRI